MRKYKPFDKNTLPKKKFKRKYSPPGNVSPYEYSQWFFNTFSGRCAKLRPNESFGQLLSRFKRVVELSGIVKEMKRREFHQTNSQKKKEKHKKALKRLRKKNKENQLVDYDLKPDFVDLSVP